VSVTRVRIRIRIRLPAEEPAISTRLVGRQELAERSNHFFTADDVWVRSSVVVVRRGRRVKSSYLEVFSSA